MAKSIISNICNRNYKKRKITYAFYRWQFIRLDPKYNKFWNSIYPKYKEEIKKGVWSRDLERKMDYCDMKYSLPLPLNPKDKFGAPRYYYGFKRGIDFWADMLNNQKNIRVLKVLPNLKIKKSIIVEINLTSPKKKIIGDLEDLISAHQKDIRKQKKIICRRMQIEKYDTYLQVYQLRVSGKKYIEIARKVFPLLYSQKEQCGLDFLIKKTERCFKEGKRLVNGGWRQIR